MSISYPKKAVADNSWPNHSSAQTTSLANGGGQRRICTSVAVLRCRSLVQQSLAALFFELGVVCISHLDSRDVVAWRVHC